MQLNNHPLVSVLMTAYNREKYIAEAIESVISSTYQNWELIIVDDQSKDRTVEIARSYKAKDDRIKVFINEKNLGDYPNRNQAANYAEGKYIKYLDSDDAIYPHGLAVMVYSMEKFPEAGFGLSAKNLSNQAFPLLTYPKATYLEHFNGFGHFDRAPGSSIIKRDAFKESGGFSGKRMIGDNELWFKLGAKYPMVKFPRDLVWDRGHPEQESKTNYARQYKMLRKEVLENALSGNECPLSVHEIKSIRSKLQTQNIKRFLKTLINV